MHEPIHPALKRYLDREFTAADRLRFTVMVTPNIDQLTPYERANLQSGLYCVVRNNTAYTLLESDQSATYPDEALEAGLITAQQQQQKLRALRDRRFKAVRWIRETT